VIPVESSERVKAWMNDHPREAWALSSLPASDALREQVVAALLRDTEDEHVGCELAMIADALEAYEQASVRGTVREPPADGERYPIEVTVTRMRYVRERGRAFYRVYFRSSHGWAGYFETRNPLDVEKISWGRRPHQPVQIIGDVVARPRDGVIVLGGIVRVL
jgi:hypothetical protein